jgi:hypothetical protein
MLGSAETRRHPAFRAQYAFEQSRNVKVGIEPRKTDAKSQLLHLDNLELFCGRVLQALDVLGRETDLYPGRQPYDDPVAPGVVMSTFGPRSCKARLAPNAAALNSSAVNSAI